MLDGVMRRLIDPPLDQLGKRVAALGISPDQLSIAGLAVGLMAAAAIALGWFAAGLVLLLASRLLDGLDGAVARRQGATDFGGYLDIVCDFLVYGAIPLGFVLNNPAANAVPGAVLLLSFYGNGTTFLGFAVLAEKRRMVTGARGAKTLYFTGGLFEGTETIAVFVLMSLFPALFPPLAYAFAAGCLVTAVSRVLLARRVTATPAPGRTPGP